MPSGEVKMPKQLSRKRVTSEEYQPDGGFVEDAPKSKKSKKGATQSDVNLAMQEDDEGNKFWEISRQRRVQISEFKGTTMVGIREFYEKDGKSLPGKKGISLTMDQFNAFIQILPQIDSVLQSKGFEVPRPDFSNTDVLVGDEPVDEDSAEDSEAELQPKSKKGHSTSKQRQNHEATSDEDE